MLKSMIHKFNRYLLILLPVAGLLSVGTVKSQTPDTDSLSLKLIISEVVQNHPMVKKALEDLNNSDAKIGYAKSATLPNVSFASSYSRIGPIENISIPNLGSFSLMPHDNYTAGFDVNQTISDFGKTEKNISLEKQSKELNLQTVEDVRQKLSKAVISNYFALVYLQEAIKIKDEQINTLNEHLHFIQKKLETGSATQYEILSTQVRISAIENQKTDLETAKQIQVYQLNSLLGKPVSNAERVKNELNIAHPDLQSDALITAALQNRDEMKLASEKAKLAEIRYSITDYQNKPVLSGFLSGGVKNGYIPYMNDPKANFVAGIGVKVPIFDGHRKVYNQLQAKSAIQINDQETEIVRRNIVEEVVESQSNLQASQKKVDQSELQLRQATQAYALAKVSFIRE